MTMNIATNNWASIRPSAVTVNQKKESLKALAQTKPSIFFEALNQFMANNDKDKADYSSNLDNELKRAKHHIKTLAENRGWNKAVTRSLALAINVKIQQVIDIIDPHYKAKGTFKTDYTLSLLGFGANDDNYKQLNKYFFDLKSSNNKVEYNNWFKDKHEIDRALNMNNETKEESKKIKELMLKNINLPKAAGNGLSEAFHRIIIDDNYLSSGNPDYSLPAKTILQLSQKQHQQNICIVPESALKVTENLLIKRPKSISSQSGKFNKKKLNKQMEENHINDQERGINLPINQWSVMQRNKPICNMVGAFCNKDSELNMNRATEYINNLALNSSDQDAKQIVVFDNRFLDNHSIAGERKKIAQHITTMENAVKNYNDSEYNSRKIQYSCTHVPIATAGWRNYFGHHDSLTHKNAPRDIAQINAQFEIITNAINSHENEQNKTKLMCIANELKNILSAGDMNAAKGILAFTLESILAEHLDCVKVVAGCKSAKDRATAAVTGMLALKAVIENKFESDNLDIKSGNKYLSSLVQNDKFDIKKFETKDKEIFFDNLHTSILYSGNLANFGVAANINIDDVFGVFTDFKYHHKLQRVHKEKLKS